MGGTLKPSLLATGPLICFFPVLSKSASADMPYWVMFSDMKDGTDELANLILHLHKNRLR